MIKLSYVALRLSGLRVSLAEPAVVPVVELPLTAAVSRWMDEQRQKCLHSLLEHQHAQAAPRQTNQPSANSGRPALRTRDVQELERRQGAGETLTDDELVSLEHAHDLVAGMMSQIARNFMPDLNTVPEKRSAKEYGAQIEQYLQECRIPCPGFCAPWPRNDTPRAGLPCTTTLTPTSRRSRLSCTYPVTSRPPTLMTPCQICLHHRPRTVRKRGTRLTSAAPSCCRIYILRMFPLYGSADRCGLRTADR